MSNYPFVKRHSKYEMMVRDFINGANMCSTIECVTRTLFFPIIMIIFLVVITKHKFTTLAFVKELLPKEYLLAQCFVLVGVIQSLTGTILNFLGKIITKYYSLITLYPSKNGLRYEINKYWNFFTCLTVFWLPILLPTILIIKFYPLNGANAIIAVSTIFVLFFTTSLNWNEVWRDKLCPRNNAKIYLNLSENKN